MSQLERQAIRNWLIWAAYRKSTFCADCNRRLTCGAARKSGPFLCPGCFDQRGIERLF